MATNNLSPIPLPAITPQVMTLARWLARKAIKEHWRRQGVRWQYMDAKDIAKAAGAYLNEHRAELVDRARAQISTNALKSNG
jgi:hypothetical protein